MPSFSQRTSFPAYVIVVKGARSAAAASIRLLCQFSMRERKWGDAPMLEFHFSLDLSSYGVSEVKVFSSPYTRAIEASTEARDVLR